ncbi:hypothetical protein C0J52_23114 [Blattella germanica]|nr:hypothetical protein C0J52_23114 [Blattella germanica]
MYMRLRRLIASNNDLVLEQLHHERRTLVQQPAFPGNLLPSTYSGYGGYGGFFFYYGNMNDSAYEEKFGSRRLSSDDDSDNQSSKPESPCLDLDFYVDIECPLELAPIDYLDKYHKPDLECRYNSMIRSMRDSEHTFQLKLSIYCPASFENRLPFMFTWSISSDNFQKLNLCVFRSDGYCSVPVDVSDTEPEITAGSVVPEPWKLSVL